MIAKTDQSSSNKIVDWCTSQPPINKMVIESCRRCPSTKTLSKSTMTTVMMVPFIGLLLMMVMFANHNSIHLMMMVDASPVSVFQASSPSLFEADNQYNDDFIIDDRINQRVQQEQQSNIHNIIPPPPRVTRPTPFDRARNDDNEEIIHFVNNDNNNNRMMNFLVQPDVVGDWNADNNDGEQIASPLTSYSSSNHHNQNHHSHSNNHHHVDNQNHENHHKKNPQKHLSSSSSSLSSSSMATISSTTTSQSISSASDSTGSFMDDMRMMATENITENVVHLTPLGKTDCVLVKVEEGIYTFQTEKSFTDVYGKMVCGLYFMASTTQFVEIEFLHFNVSCKNEGLLSVVDGWELKGQFFPSLEDHPVPRNARFHEFCDDVRPTKPFLMSQNVGLIEYRIPTPKQSFTVRVRFIDNPKPCNQVIQGVDYGIYTLRNYGRRINCTLSIIFSAKFNILSLNVGQSYRRLENIIHSPRNYIVETGVIRKCKKRGMGDYVEFRGGQGLDTNRMIVSDDVCGFRPFPYKKDFQILCSNTAVRLVSSGQYDNQIEFSYEPMIETEPEKFSSSLVCPPSAF